ncbi:MAG: TolC family protein [Syntrophotaleaceae bacterium]
MAPPLIMNNGLSAPVLRKGRFGGYLSVVMAVILLLFVWSPAMAAPLTIGVVMDGPWAGNEPLLELFKRELTVLTRGEFPLHFPSDKTLVADWTMEGVERKVDTLLNDPKVDLLLGIGVLTSHHLAHRGPLPKPTVAPFTVDHLIQGYPKKGDGSGVSNFTYLASPSPILRDLRYFTDLVNFKKLAVLTYRPYLNAIPELSENLRTELHSRGIAMTAVPVEGKAADVLAALPEDTDAVYVTPLLGLAPEEFQVLIEGLKQRRLPSFSYFGQKEVEQGILAGVASESDFSRLARRTALTLQSILLGDAPGKQPVLFSSDDHLVINMATARAIDFSPTWAQLVEAELVAEDVNRQARPLTLAKAVHEAMTANLELAAAERRIAAGEAEVRKVRGALLPQLGIAANGLLIDEDRAEASFGTQAERSLTGALVLEQSLYSERLRTGFDVERHQQKARLQEQRELRLDIAQAASTGYLNVLRAKTLLSIQKNNLRVTRSNLELARRRRDVGFSGPAEVYRWESQLATDRNEVVQAATRQSLAEIELNRLLQRPAEEAFSTEEVDLSDSDLLISDRRMEPYLATPAAYARFRDFMVEEGLAEVPELQRIDQAIAAAERVRVAARRSFWAPDLTLGASLGQRFYEGGEGTDSPFGDFPLPVEIPEDDDTDWSVGLNLSLPLFAGGALRAELDRANHELDRLRLDRRALADRLEQRIRSALQLARASHTGIGLARQSAAAAGKNLELVTDAYSRGVVSIIELLDAQNAALVANRVAANAVYNYFIDLMAVQRATGRFDFFLDADQRENWYQRLEEFWRQESSSTP